MNGGFIVFQGANIQWCKVTQHILNLGYTTPYHFHMEKLDWKLEILEKLHILEILHKLLGKLL